MQNYAKSHGLTEFVSMQNYHCAIYREEEREMVPLLQVCAKLCRFSPLVTLAYRNEFLKDLGVGMIPWSPLARGFLTRPVHEQTPRANTDA